MIDDRAEELGRLERAVLEHHGQLLEHDGVWAVGIGIDKSDDALAINIFVEPSLRATIPEEKWRAMLGGRLVVVEAHPPRIDEQPLPEGSITAVISEGLTNGVVVAGRSISVKGANSYGTLGAPVKVTGKSGLYGLTCYHVVGATVPPPVTANIIVQPGTKEQGPRDTIGVVSDGVMPGSRPVGKPQLDAAVISLTAPSPAYIKYVGRLAAVRDPSLGQSVRKYGATTGFTSGDVDAFKAWVKVKYATKTLSVGPAMIISMPNGRFSSPGDSGSVVVDESNNAVGMIFAGDDDHKSRSAAIYFTDINTILSTTLLPAPLAPRGAPAVFLAPTIGTDGANQTIVATADSSNLLQTVVRENDMYFPNPWTTAANPKVSSAPKGGQYLKETHIAYMDSANNLIDVWYDAASRTNNSKTIASNVKAFAPPTYFWWKNQLGFITQVMFLIYADTDGWLHCASRDNRGNWTYAQLTSSTVGEPASGFLQSGLFTDFGGFFMAFYLDTNTATAGRLCLSMYNAQSNLWATEVVDQMTFVSISNPMNFLDPSGAYMSVCGADADGWLWMAQYFASPAGWEMNPFTGSTGVAPDAPKAFEAPSMAGTVFGTTLQWHVCYRDKDSRHLYLVFWDQGAQTWTVFQLTGPGSLYFSSLPAAATPPVISSDGGRAYCVYRDDANNLWHLWWVATGSSITDHCHALL